ncbi:MAG: translation initiation factor IF-3 [Candidatus Curtissbacteria bacterium]|nr:translation initiation factor IF-3 [Candidatus Curtissbacteria bacterium]
MKRYFKQNHQITAPEVRVIDDEGKQVGILSLSQALAKAQEEEKDLVEISSEAKPPVVKIIDFKKFKYLEEKKEKEAKKHAKQTELKEVRFSPFIGEHDLNTALEKVKKFLKSGDMVKISVVFKGRQMAHQEFGPKMLDKIMSNLEGLAEQERDARFEGRRYVTVVRPTKGTVKQEVNDQLETGNKKQETTINASKSN